MTELVKLHHSEAGQGLPVVLLHGFPLSSAIWRKQQQSLSNGYRVITPDLRGHGQSPAPAGVYEMEAMAADLFALLDSLHVKQAVILGHSMGGYVTLAAWRLAPERFLGLGLIASHAAADTDEGRQCRFKLAGKVASEGSEAVATAMIPKLFATSLADNDPLAEDVRQIILETPRAGIIGSLNGMAVRRNSEEMLPEINVPTLILAGDHDQIIPRAKAEVLAAILPHATLAVIPGAGHMLMLEQPEPTTAAIRGFLSAAIH